MEFFIFLILFIGFLVLLYTVVKALNERRIQSKAEQILDKKFDGTATVTYRVDATTGLRYDQVLLGAEQRGYALYSKNQDTKNVTTLVFKKQPTLEERVAPHMEDRN